MTVCIEGSIDKKLSQLRGFPDGSAVKNPPANAEGRGFHPWVRKNPGEGNGNSLQYSCLENSMDRGAWQAI